jgi:hypothetical protein
MIVRANGASLLLVTQPDHAALAARIMDHWRAGGFSGASRRDSILSAIEQHDHGWLEVDAAPLVDLETGRLLDFVAAPGDIKRAIWPRGVERLAAAPHAAALVAQHALHIYRRYRTEPDWASFFAGMESARDRHLRNAGAIAIDDLMRDYLFLRIGDLMSLTFCNGWTETQTDDAGVGYEMRLDVTRLVVTPDPFDGREVPLEVAARELPARPFRSAADARNAFAAAPTVMLRGAAHGRKNRS